ncbi:MAG: KH domain-containing protein [Anaerolineae bacterium]|nr:KH domain-containing protein [Anaerolineae bacterium]MCB0203905.1 KH domain-containing protein [Anaerolineae bacterium]MCB0253801.1 KH domain-containing protein [Anaerolineae bacterium]
MRPRSNRLPDRNITVKDLIEYIAQNLVDDVDKVRVREIRTRQGMLLELRVARDDMGRVIGSGGRVANAMRAVLRVPANRQGKQVNLEIV